jgi:hypothetical protein
MKTHGAHRTVQPSARPTHGWADPVATASQVDAADYDGGDRR